jgi:hypothetical protein
MCIFLTADGICVALAFRSPNQNSMNTFSAGPHEKIILKGKQNTKFVNVQSALRVEVNDGPEVKDKEERKRGGKEGCKWHLEGGLLYMAHVTGICLEFINIYDTRSRIEGIKGLRANSVSVMLEKWRE